MGCDLVVALGRATVDGQTLFGQNTNLPANQPGPLHRTPGRPFAVGEKTHTQHLELPQVRQTYTAVGCRPEGEWGYHHGVNEHGLAVGCTALRGKLRCPQPFLTGPDLVRLALERCRSATQAMDLVTDLIGRHGQ